MTSSRQDPRPGTRDSGPGTWQILQTYTRDLSQRDLKHLFTLETPEAYRFFARGIDERSLAGLPWHRRVASRCRQFLIAFTSRLSPARRLLYGVGLLAAILGLLQRWPNSTFWLLAGFVAMNLLVLLEVADRLTLKRDLENETRSWVEEIDQRLQSLESSLGQRRALIAALDITPEPEDLDARRVELLSRRALLTDPCRRSASGDLREATRRVEQIAAEQIEKWQRAMKAVEDGTRAIAAGATRDALAHFEVALRIEPASRRAAADLDRGRRTMADQRAIAERADALLDEARKAAGAKQWQAAVVLCDDALRLAPGSEEAAALKRKAVKALETEAFERRLDCDRALGRAEAYRRKGRFQHATAEIARARTIDPTAPEVDAADERLKASIAESEREVLWGQQAAEAVAAARNLFSSGQREQALADLRTFHSRVPHAMVISEISLLEAEAKRHAAAEQAAAEAAEHANAAEAALAAGNPQGVGNSRRRSEAAGGSEGAPGSGSAAHRRRHRSDRAWQASESARLGLRGRGAQSP